MAQDLPYRARAIEPGDEKLIFATWLNSFEPYRDRRVPRDLYYAEQHALISKLLAESVKSGHGLVACTKDDPSMIVGWLSGRPGGVLDYVFVKSIYRRMGVAKFLLDSFNVRPMAAFTHYTEVVPMLRIAGLLPNGAVYNPYLTRR